MLMNQQNKIRIYYDGNCPLCCSKRDFLKRRDKKNCIEFVDIRAADFQTLEISASAEQLEKEIHCILPDGRILRGMDVIREAYRKIGLGWLAAPTAWPLLSPLFDALYAFIARNRLRISRLAKKRIR